MKHILFLSFMILGTLAMSVPDIRAQDNLAAFTAEMTLFNRTPAARNPAFHSTKNYIFNTRILDTNRQLVGRFGDMKISADGTIHKLVSKINWISQGQTIEHNLGTVTFIENKSAWEIPLLYEGERIIPPESEPSTDPGQTYSLRNMIGAEIRREGGRWIGVVVDVMLNDEATKIAALLANDVPGAGRYDTVAIPFHPDLVRVNDRFGTLEFRVTDPTGQAIEEFADENF